MVGTVAYFHTIAQKAHSENGRATTLSRETEARAQNQRQYEKHVSDKAFWGVLN